jgi:hypothetical protein
MTSSGVGAGGPASNSEQDGPRSKLRRGHLARLLTLGYLIMLGCLHSAGSAAPVAPVTIPRTCGGVGPESLEVALVNEARAPALALSICDWFRDEPLRVSFAPAPRLAPLVVRAPRLRHVAVVLESQGEARLYFVPPGREGAVGKPRWVRSIALASGLDDAGVEVIAQALHSTVLAAALEVPEPRLEAAGSAAKGATKAAEKAPADAPRRAGLPVRTAIGYHFYARGAEPFTHGPVLRVELDWQTQPLALGTFARALALTSGHTRAGGLDVSLSGASLGAGLCASAPLSKVIGRVALGGSVDLLELDVQVVDPEALRLTGDRRARPRAFVGMEAGFNYRSGDVELALAGLLRWQLSASHYEILDGQELSTVLVPWRLQPGAAVEVAYVW